MEHGRCWKVCTVPLAATLRRMLGNIQFIGYLYKNGLLTER